jgi:hypothetical protein
MVFNPTPWLSSMSYKLSSQPQLWLEDNAGQKFKSATVVALFTLFGEWAMMKW